MRTGEGRAEGGEPDRLRLPDERARRDVDRRDLIAGAVDGEDVATVVGGHERRDVGAPGCGRRGDVRQGDRCGRVGGQLPRRVEIEQRDAAGRAAGRQHDRLRLIDGVGHRQEPDGRCLLRRKGLLVDDPHRLEIDDVERATGGGAGAVRDDGVLPVRRQREPQPGGADDDAGPDRPHDATRREDGVERVARRQLTRGAEPGGRGEGNVRHQPRRTFRRPGRCQCRDRRQGEHGTKQEAPQAAP